ncbi:hypothetical protein BJ546DRAFT_1061067 [Cryomyces antarcticus]|uniref:Plasma membrane proteolipid 3 n=1 Tax=Cryomyces antarcticus TaxID=329879 RepID=A0ABR0LXK4_9PEZI|nr:hypothetical protein LTR60_003116 [Cryomyces antarcticus]KAK5165316.1 hypothetical protein LTR04_001389 [Oleoguttula sp. CCFEE 6159]KAK5256157.1 hypothetical protein LTR16_003893 [Cryomyces antarcticus]
MIPGIVLVIITIIFPPLGVYLVSDCGADLLINVVLTCLGFLPGHIHAFYVEYVYYDRREKARQGRYESARAPGVYSDKAQTGGMGYGTVAPGQEGGMTEQPHAKEGTYQ